MQSAQTPPRDALHSGYRFWGVVILAILLVELAGAAAHWLNDKIGVKIPWTTISGMVGHLEELWPTTAVFVVGLLAPAAFYALTPIDSQRRSPLGRVTIRQPSEQPVEWYSARVVFLLSALVGAIAVGVFEDDFIRAYFIYGALFVFGILVPTFLLLAKRRDVGFTSLFVTIGHLRQNRDWKARLVTIALSAGLAILAIHLAFYPWPDITKERVVYAGLQAKDAKTRATREIVRLRAGAPITLTYSTQAREVANGQEAWAVYFIAADGSTTGCKVIVTDKQVKPTPECSPSTPPAARALTTATGPA